jgi:alpha-tubulin suppressor-like RCC1 family protein
MYSKYTKFILPILLTFNLYGADYYWVGGNGNWSDFSNHWATTSDGNSFHTNVPTNLDDVFFDEFSSINFNDTIFIDVNAFCNNIKIYGYNKIKQLANFNVSGQFDLAQGNYFSNGYNLNINQFYSNYSFIRKFDISNTNLNLTGSDTIWNITPVSFTFTQTASSLNLTYTGNDMVIFNSGGDAQIYENVNCNVKNLKFIENTTFTVLTLPPAIHLYLPTFNTFGLPLSITSTTINCLGNCISPIIIEGIPFNTNTEKATLNINTGTLNADFTRIKNINGINGTYNFLNSIDLGNNTGLTITEDVSTAVATWINGTGNWSDPLHWSTGCIPGPNNSVLFNAASFSAIGQTVNIDVDAYCDNMTWTGVNNPILIGSTNDINIRGDIELDVNMTTTFSNSFKFNSITATPKTITSNGVLINGDFEFNSLTGSHIFLDDFTSNKSIQLYNDTVTSIGINMTLDAVISGEALARSLDITNSTYTLTGVDSTWVMNPLNLTLTTLGSEIIIDNILPTQSIIKGGGQTYNTFRFLNTESSLYDDNSFSILEIAPNSSLVIESGSSQSMDSLIANGSCSEMITIESTDNYGLAATINKTGYDTLIVSSVNLMNVTSTSTAPKYNLAENSTVNYTTTGWDTTDIGLGTVFYWINGSGEWKDIAHWESPLGIAATCLPSIRDTVYFNASSFILNEDSVLVNSDAYFSHMDWAGSEIWNPKLHLIKNLHCRDNILFNTSMQVDNSNPNAQIKFIPENNNCVFTTFETPINTNITLSGLILTDTLTLNGDLKLNDDNSLFIAAGTFDTNSDSIHAGTFKSLGNQPNLVLLNNSAIELKYLLDFSTLSTLNSATSNITLNTSDDGGYFIGQSFTYNDVTISSSNSEMTTNLTGSNNFNNLTFIKGLRITLEDNQSQLVSGTFNAIGNCQDSIFVMSKTDATPSTLNLTNSGNAECVSARDINILSSPLNALFSSNIINNTGLWNFDVTPSSSSLFATNYNQCLGDATVFTNTSTSYSGGVTGLTFEWDFGNGNFSTVNTPTVTYGTAQKFYVSLITTYTNFCTDTYKDSVNINNPIGQLISGDLDTSICANESVFFNALSSPQADNYDFIINGISSSSSALQTYDLTTLDDGDIVTLEVTLNGCSTTSANQFTFNVNPLPTLTLTASSSTICDGENVTFTATGADIYRFFIDGNPQTGYTAVNTFSSNTLLNGQVISVIGKNTTTECEQTGNVGITMTVNPNPVPLMTNNDVNNDNVICNGTAITFTATNATDYQFFVNGVLTQATLATPTFTTNTLSNGDNVTVIGTSLDCHVESLDNYTFIVNSIPNTTMTNPIGTTICETDNISFTANGATAYQFFVDGNSVQGPSGLPTYSTSLLTNGQTVYVTGSANNCFSNSAIQTFTVNPLPITSLVSLDLDTTICQFESVDFNATGATNYQFLLDGFPIGPFSPTASYTTDSLNNGQTVSVIGSQLGCFATSTDAFNFTVKPSFNVTLFSSDNDLTICNGEPINFTGIGGSGVTSYDIYINNALENSSVNNSFTLSSLNTGTQLISLSATKNGCTYYANDTLSILVKPIPTVSLSNSDLDAIICQGDSVLFIANGAIEYDFLVDGFSQVSPLQDSLYLSNLTNGQVVSVIGTSAGCSSISTSFTFTVNAIPDVILTSDNITNIICEGEDILLTSSGATNYEFIYNGNSLGASSTTSTLSTSSLVLTANTVIEVIGEFNNCYSNSLPIHITVNTLPDINVVSSDLDNLICENELVTITANGSSTYQLLINNMSTTSPTIQNQFNLTTLSNGDVITVQGYSANGCFSVSTDFFNFTVNPNPIVVLSSTEPDSSICINDPVIFTPTGALTYTYFVDGQQVNTGSTYTTSTIENGQIITAEGNLNGCTSISNSLPFTVHLYPVTFLTTTDLDSIICIGDSVLFEAQGGFDYEFFLNGNSIQGPSTSDSLYITTLTNGDVITVSGANNGCETLSNPIPIEVIVYPSTILVSSNPTNEICYGELVTFSTNGASNYEFFVNDISQGAASPTPILNITTLEHGDSVWVIGNNGTCITNAPQVFEMIVNTLPLTLTSTGNNLICNGDPVDFMSSGADLYEFFVDGNSVQALSANTTLITTNLQNGQTISVNGFSALTGCTQLAQTTHLVTVMDLPIITSLNTTTLCEGDSVVLISSSPTWNQWYSDSNPILNANDTSYTTYNSGDYYTEITLGGDGNITALGNNSFGQLGNSTTISDFYKVDTDNLENIEKISSGKNHTLALDINGIVYSWGANNYGQIGDGTFTTSITPYTTNITTASDISAGHQFSLALLSTGEIQSWGENDLGQLGLGNTNTTNFPLIISGISNVSQIASGQNHSIALLNDGTIWSWGDNQFGQLGIGTFINQSTPQQLTGLSGIESINCGSNHTLAIDSLGNLYVWGHNSEGQLGIANIQFSNIPIIHTLSNVQSADGGLTHTLALTSDNKLFSWGNNINGQLGIGNNTNSTSPQYISSLDAVKTIATNFNHNYVIKNDNSVWSWGENSSGQTGIGNNLTQTLPIHIPSLTGITEISMGESHSTFITGFSNSCSSNTINVIVNPSPDVIITLNNSILSVSVSGTAYQWFINGILIPGATANNYTPITHGYYTCEVNFLGGCSNLSIEYPFGIVETNENSITELIIYPNPNKGKFNITGNLENYDNLKITIHNTLGQKVTILETITSQDLIKLQLYNQPGIYYLTIESTNEATYIHKIVIE